mmetsp:Transcript_76340/g.196581  ORF Transcript_76340/g.196581 Transcript_76340/m.196581 type:complete len:90 (+) Transcript_76340:754-1023(+)
MVTVPLGGGPTMSEGPVALDGNGSDRGILPSGTCWGDGAIASAGDGANATFSWAAVHLVRSKVSSSGSTAAAPGRRQPSAHFIGKGARC